MVEICAASDSTCEKSGFSVASTAVSAFGLHLRSSPASESTLPCSSGVPSPSRGSLVRLAVANGATTRWEWRGRSRRPVSLLELQTKQLTSRGRRAVKKTFLLAWVTLREALRLGLDKDDNALFNLLKKSGFNDVRAESPPSSFRAMAPVLLLTVLLIVVFFFMLRKVTGTGSAIAFGQSRGKLYAQEDIGVTFNDVAGLEGAGWVLSQLGPRDGAVQAVRLEQAV